MHWRHLEYFWKNVEDPCHRCVTCSSWIRIVMKLPQTLQSSWRKLVHVIEENCKDVMFEDLVKFIDQQWQIHPVFSADALQEAENKVKSGKQQFNLNRSDRKTLLATNLAPTRTPETVIKHASDQDVQTSSCQLCHNSHDLDDCKAYIRMSLRWDADSKTAWIRNSYFDHWHRQGGRVIEVIEVSFQDWICQYSTEMSLISSSGSFHSKEL